jgi:hypothetical protein
MFWAQTVVASVAALLAITTFLLPDWIEQIIGIDPDHHTGSIEWNWVLALCLTATLFAALARRSRLRASSAVGIQHEDRSGEKEER